MAGGAGAFASHEASSALWTFRPAPTGPIDVTAVGRTVRARGIRGHEVTALAAADTRSWRGIPLTAPARALLEIAPRLTTRELSDAVEQAQVKRLVTKRDIERTIERAGPRPAFARCGRSSRNPHSRARGPSGASSRSCARRDSLVSSRHVVLSTT